MTTNSFLTRVKSIDKLSSDTVSITLEAVDGDPFKFVDAGAHIDVHAFMGALIRQYSIWSVSEDRKSVSIAVKREENGRGGSRFMHTLDIGEELTISGPNNHFPLDGVAPESILIAGGIGITPIALMAKSLKDNERNFKLYYLSRSSEDAAFKEILQEMQFGSALHMHYDDRDGLFDIAGLVNQLDAQTHIYICGPEPLLEAVLKETKDWDEGRVHFERFSAASLDASANNSFEVVINSSQQILSVPADRTLLSVLDEAGHFIPYACESGICGSCMVDVLEGEIEHRDDIISEDEKATNSVMCVCVSRAKNNRLVLDL